MNEPEPVELESMGIGLQSFIRVRDSDGGDVLVNVAEIVGVFELLGRAAEERPGAKARIMLRSGGQGGGGVNVPVAADIDQITALLSQIAIVAIGEYVDETLTPLPPRIYTPDNNR